jgi:hypothetical protein
VLTLIIVATQLAGDAANLAMRDYVRGVIGIVIAGAILLWLLQFLPMQSKNY